MSNTPAWLTVDYLQIILHNSFNDKELKLKDFDVSSGSNLGDGYASQIFRIKINTTKKKLSIIAKVLLTSATIEAVQKILNVFDKEKLMLQCVLPELLIELQNSDRFFPKFYYADDVNRALFIEDLCEDAYQLCQHSSNGLDLKHSLLVMDALAKLHGASYLYFKENPNMTKNFETYFQCEENKSFLESMVKNTRGNLMEILDDLKLPEELKQKLKNGNGWCSKIIDSWKRKDDQFNMLIQTDCWINNLMFKYNKNNVESVKIVDFQLATYHCSAFDLVNFIFSSTDMNVKTNHLNTLLDRYFEVFTSITGKINDFNKDRLWKEFNERLFNGFISTIALMPVVMAPPKSKHLDLDAIMDEPNTEIYKNPKFLECLEILLPYFDEHNAI